MPKRGYRKNPDTGEYVMTEKSTLPYYHTIIASIAKSNEADFTRPTVTRDYVDMALDKYREMGYELFSATPVESARDAVTVLYVLKLRDD